MLYTDSLRKRHLIHNTLGATRSFVISVVVDVLSGQRRPSVLGNTGVGGDGDGVVVVV